MSSLFFCSVAYKVHVGSLLSYHPNFLCSQTFTTSKSPRTASEHGFILKLRAPTRAFIPAQAEPEAQRHRHTLTLYLPGGSVN